jgi:putative ABC transport system permease protein
VFSAMALYDQSGPGLNLGGADRPQQIKGVHISADYFKVFGANPMLGRTFTAPEDAPNGPKAAIVSEKLWRSHFASDPAILNRTVTLNSESYPIVGVMPDSFVANPAAEVWIPLQADPNSTNQGNYLHASARLKRDVSIERARR